MRGLFSVITLVIVSIIISLSFVGVDIPNMTIIVLPIFGIMYLLLKKSQEQLSVGFNYIDLSILMIFTYEIINPFCVNNIEVAIYSGFHVVAALVLYFIVTNNLLIQHIKYLLYTFSVISLILSLLLIITFVLYIERANNSGFSVNDIIALRYMYNPMNMQINDWGTTMLLLYPFSLLSVYFLDSKYRKYSLVILTVNTYALLITFSRGAYIAYAISILFISLFAWKHAYKQVLKKRYFAIVVTIFIIVIIPIRKPVLDVIKIHATSTQERSTNGRFVLWEKCLDISKEHPIFGIGSGNFPEISKIISYKTGEPYSRRVTNSYLQILVEKGIVGLTLYVILFIFLIYYIIKSKNKFNIRIPIIIICALFLSIGFREFTFSTLFDEDTPFGLLILWISIFRIFVDVDSENCSKRFRNYTILVSSSLFFAMFIYNYMPIYKLINKNISKFVITPNSDGVIEIDHKENVYSPVVYYNAGMGYVCENDSIDFNTFVVSCDILLEENGNRHKIINNLELAIKYAPYEPVFSITLGWLYINSGQLRRGMNVFGNVVKFNKSNYISCLSLGLCYEKLCMIDSAKYYYCNAIIQTPYIVDSYFFKDLLLRNNELAKNVVDEAMTFLKNSNNDGFSVYKLAKLYYFKDEYELKGDVLMQHIDSLPNLSRAWVTLGDIRLAERKFNDAHSCYRKAAFLDETDYIAYDRLYNFSILENKPNKVIKRQVMIKYSNHNSNYTRHFHNIYKLNSVVNVPYPTNIMTYMSPMLTVMP